MTSRAMISLIAMSAILVASSCVGTPTHDKEWETAKPGDVGLDPGPLAELFGTIDAGDIETLHAVIVVRNGKIVFEKYSGDFGRDDLQYTASVSKSVGSILFGVFDNPMGQLNDLAILTRYVLPSVDASFSGPRELDSSPETGLETYVGRYVSGDETILVSLRDGELHADAEGAPTMRLRRVGAHRFVGTVLDRLDVSFAFEIDDEGSCEGLRAWHGFNYRELDRVKD